MLRYLGLAWNPDSPDQTAIANRAMTRFRAGTSGWTNSVNVPGMCLFVYPASERIITIHGRDSHTLAVVGAIFSNREQPRSIDTALSDDFDAIVQSGGASLTKNYWGSYIAFLRHHPGRITWTLRSPMASLACLTSEHRGVHFVFSRSEDFARLKLGDLSVNWDYVAVHVALGTARGRETGVREITELKSGEYLRTDPERAVRGAYWHPLAGRDQGIIDDPAEAARLVRATTMTCVRRWAERYPRILHRLSGGLDSSIVAACLRSAPTNPVVTCLNQYSPGADGDERPFARMVAEHTGYTLIEERRNPNTRLEGMLGASPIANPQCGFMDFTLGGHSAALARREGADALFDGTLGDVIFHRQPVIAGVADFIQHRGLNPALLGVSLEIAAMDRLSLWSTLSTGIREAIQASRPGKHVWWKMFSDAAARAAEVRTIDLANRSHADTLIHSDRFVHPWFLTQRKLPSGAAWQLLGMSFNSIEDAFARPQDPEKVHPLMSQPLVELCLRFPAYVHLHNGWDRAIARLAFANDLPSAIVRRTSKGGLEDHAKWVVTENIEFIREVLLDGALVRERLLDRNKLEDALSGNITRNSTLPSDILTHLDTELWLRPWTDRRFSAAA